MISSGYPSSALSDPDEFIDQRERTETRLNAYKPLRPGDDTHSFFRLVLGLLPKEGSLNMMEDILSLDDEINLRQLRNHFVDAILKPRKIRPAIFGNDNLLIYVYSKIYGRGHSACYTLIKFTLF